MKKTYVKINLVSPEKIESWSRREIKKRSFYFTKDINNVSITNSIFYNYTFTGEIIEDNIVIKHNKYEKFNKLGLFSETIFGPISDFTCQCKNLNHKYYEFFLDCENCGVNLTFSKVRKYQMGHIPLILPFLHTWFFWGNINILKVFFNIPFFSLKNLFYCNFFKKEYLNIINLFDIYQGLVDESKSFNDQDEELIKLIKIKLLELNTFTDKIKKNKKKELSKKLINEIFFNFLNNFDIFKELNLLFDKINTDINNTYFYPINDIKKFRILENFYYTKTNPAWIFLKNIPVMPPELRPYATEDNDSEGSSQINLIYQSIIRKNNRLSKILTSNINNKDILINNEIRILQESIDFLIDNIKLEDKLLINNRPMRSLSSILKGKFGRFRKSILGKRVNFSARSVITVNPQLKIYQCGVPFKILNNLFNDFIKQIFNEEFSDINLLTYSNKIIIKILKKILDSKIVLLNRAPTLHRLGIQAFSPILIAGNAIQIHPLVCSTYNADFDGDQMSIHFPLSKLSEIEIKKIIITSENLFLFSNGEIKLKPSQDLILGLVYLTIKNEKIKYFSLGQYFNSFDDFFSFFITKKLNIHTPIWFKSNLNIINKNIQKNIFIRTTPGRLLLNNLLNVIK